MELPALLLLPRPVAILRLVGVITVQRQQEPISVRLCAILFHMLTNFRKGYTFVHIPKTGGEAIRNQLERDGAVPIGEKHTKFRDIGPLQLLRTRNHYVFAVLHEPLEQVRSFYRHLRKPEYETFERLSKQYADFADKGYLNPVWASKLALAVDFDTWVQLVYEAKIADSELFDDQVSWLMNMKGQRAVNAWRFDQLNKHFREFALRFDLDTQLRVTNESRADTTDVPSARTIEIIHRHFKNTYAAFDWRLVPHDNDHPSDQRA